MSKTCRMFAVVTAATLLFAVAARAATIDEIEKVATDKWEGLSTVAYDMEMNMDMGGEGFSMKSSTTGKTEMSHKGDKWLMYSTMKSSSVQKVAGNETKTDTAMESICDGEFMYTLMDNAGNKTAMKSKAADFTKNAGGKEYFKFLKENNELTVLPDAEVDGKAVYVVQAKPKQAGAGAMTFSFDKETGMVIQTTTAGPDGKVMSTMKVKNLKLGAAVDASHFTFKAPEGVTVQDMTKQ